MRKFLFFSLVIVFQTIYAAQIIKAQEKISVKEATLNIEVENYQVTKLQIFELLKKNKAEVLSEKEHFFKTQTTNQLVIRIENHFINDITEEIAKLAVQINVRKIEVIDVTLTTANLDKELATKEEIREKYSQILQKTQNVNEIAATQNKLNEINAEISALTDRRKRLNEANMGTINLLVFESANSQVVIEKEGVFNLKNMKHTNLFQLTVIFGVPIIIILLLGYFVYKRYRRIQRRKKRISKNSTW